MGEPVPFIVGCGRSGTTLLRSMLDSHPALAIPGENDLLLDQLDRGTPFARGAPIDGDELDRLVRGSRATASSLGEHTAAVPGPTATVGEWIRHAYGAYAAAQGKPRFGDKTPGLVRHMPRVVAAVPDAVFVHLIRDGRDVARAFVEQDWGPTNVSRAARVWRRHVTIGRSVGLTLGHDRYLEARYEDLVADPERTLRPICSFLHLDYEASMLAHGESAERAIAYSTEPGAHDRLTEGVTAGLRDWRRDMGIRERLAVELRAGSALELCGYELGLPQRAVRALGIRTRRLARRARER